MGMTLESFYNNHWKYYLVLEEDFLKTQRYVEIDLGDDISYITNTNVKNIGNSRTFSIEYVKQYQAICSELETISKIICEYLGNSDCKNIKEYTEVILDNYGDITSEVVEVLTSKHFQLRPYEEWTKGKKYKSPTWWKIYNEVKHNRAKNYENANLKNVISALSGLYLLELYFLRKLSKEGEGYILDDQSELFNVIGWKTRPQYIIAEQGC